MTRLDERADDGTSRAAQLFSTPFEVGLRAVFILNASTSRRYDVRRLVVYDYLLVHSADAIGGPQSLHPATPHRAGELLVKRDLMRAGLTLFVGREIIAVHLDEQGVNYSVTDLTDPFLNYIHVPYAERVRAAAQWVTARFDSISDNELDRFVSANLDRWGGEFQSESLVREVFTP